MAGKFLSIEEAARQLKVTVEEVQRLVDRKKLFPMRDGATLKFKADEIERVAGDLAAGGPDSDAPVIDGAPAGADKADQMAVGGPLDEGDWVFAASEVHAGSQTIVRGGPADAAAAAADASGLSFASDVGAGPQASAAATFEDDLVLDSIAAGSVIAGAADVSGLNLGSPAAADAGGMTLDLGQVIGGAAAGGGLSGLSPGGSGPGLALGSAAGSGAGAALSGPLDSGLSLEDADINVSGIDLAAASGIGSAVDAGGSLAAVSVAAGSLAGDAFDLGDVGEDESASVVIATDDTGDSSFFGAATDDSASASVSLEESSISDVASGLGVGLPPEFVVDTTFSVWQVLALACCTLLMLTASLVMFDLTSTIRAPGGSPLSAPLLNALSETLGWR